MIFCIIDWICFQFSYHIYPRPRHTRNQKGEIEILKIGALKAGSVITIQYIEANTRVRKGRTEPVIIDLKIVRSGSPFASIISPGYTTLEQVEIAGYIDASRHYIRHELRVGFLARIMRPEVQSGIIPIKEVLKIIVVE